MRERRSPGDWDTIVFKAHKVVMEWERLYEFPPSLHELALVLCEMGIIGSAAINSAEYVQLGHRIGIARLRRAFPILPRHRTKTGEFGILEERVNEVAARMAGTIYGVA